jgi:hypothetical protein
MNLTLTRLFCRNTTNANKVRIGKVENETYSGFVIQLQYDPEDVDYGTSYIGEDEITYTLELALKFDTSKKASLYLFKNYKKYYNKIPNYSPRIIKVKNTWAYEEVALELPQFSKEDEI